MESGEEVVVGETVAEGRAGKGWGEGREGEVDERGW